MNGNKSASASSKRTYRTIKVNPTTSAIRAALAVSATLLALTGSTAAYAAGSCLPGPGLLEVTCNGDFTDDVTTGYVGATVPDLTLIVGDDGASTVVPGSGTFGISSYWGGDATIINYADIETDGADGIHMESDVTGTVENHGSIDTYAGSDNYASAIDVYADGDVTVTNDGTLNAHNNWSYDVSGIYVDTDGGFVTVTNEAGGSIYASSDSGSVTGINVYYASEGATVTNDGYIVASTFTGNAVGIYAWAEEGTLAINNGGEVRAITIDGGNTTGIYAYSDFGDATVTNTGTVYVGGPGYAEGIYASAPEGTATINSSGTIDVTSYDGGAVGASAYGKYADVTNSGVIEVRAAGNATGIAAYGYDGSTITNSGPVTVTAYGFTSDAAGIDVYSHGAITITNSGDITVTSNGDGTAPSASTVLPFEYGANAVGISAVSEYGFGGLPTLLDGPSDVNEVNTADIVVNAAGNGVGMYAAAIGAGNVYMNNADPGSITVTAGGYGVGMWGYSDYGTIEMLSSGQITVTTDTAGATGIYAESTGDGGTVTITNSAGIDAYSQDDYGIGIWVKSYGNDAGVTVANSGALYAESHDYIAVGIQVYAGGDHSDISVTTTGGSIDAYSYNDYATGMEVRQYGYEGTIYVNNGGDINAESFWSDATGIAGTTRFDAGSLEIQNSGAVTVQAYSNALGIAAYGNAYGDTTVGNAGTLDVTSDDADAKGIYAFSSLANVYVDNTGAITASGYNNAWGIYAQSGISGGGDVNVTSGGTITVSAGYGDAYGIRAYTEQYGNINVSNSGTIDVTQSEAGNYGAYGIYTWQDSGDGATVVDNSGSVTVDGQHWAYGVYAQSGGDYSSVSVTNSGSFDVTSSGNRATGIYVWSGGYGASLTVDNSGTISADAYYDAKGISAQMGFTDKGYVDVSNSGSIDAYSEADRAFGIYVTTNGDVNDSTITVDSSGTIMATANYNAYGIYSLAQYNGAGLGAYTETTISNGGVIEATSNNFNAYGIAAFAGDYATISVDNSGTITANGYYNATGILGDDYRAMGEVTINNDGEINANAVGGLATLAFGISADSYYGAYVTTGEGSVINAYATGDDANAYGVLEVAGYAYFYNHGEINATVDAGTGYAWGAYISSPNQVYVYNYGDITATAYGADTQSVGIVVESINNSAGVYNDGTIYAYADNIATGVWLASDTIGYVYNFGTIAAYGGVHSIAVYSSGASNDYINNYGVIVGEIWSNAGNDYLYNGADGAWYTYDTSYFGDGDDGILNYGLISMNNATIDLGYHDVTGNYFDNYGTIAVDGADNVINMGNGPLGPLVPSLNPLPFYNGVGGVIDFQDGDPDDRLTIVGDFAGDGDINVDVSGLDGVSDILYIDGSVVDGTSAPINVDLLDLPDAIESLIPIVYVSGDSVASNFTLGDVNWDEDNSFVTLDFGIIADIDADNSDPDVFSLGIEVTGLSDPGTLAASVGSSVQSLMNTQVGTWRQRMGVIDSFNKGAIALWARVFSNEGSFSPEHDSNFGLGGNFDWEQKNSGVEGGIDFSVTDEFSIGLLLSKSQADTDLDNGGHGSADIDADTWGVYGTWISPNGFYLDASYRWMNFDVDLNSVAGNMETEGDAEAFNVELGYAWTLSGGLKIEPQLQYTKTSVNNIDTLVTSTGMTFAHDGGDSSRGRLGVAIRKSFGEADTGWLWTPYATLSAVREFDGESVYLINDTFVGASNVEGTSTLLEVGFTARHQNWSIYGGLNWEDGGAVDSFFGGQLGVRYTFGGPAPAPAPVVVPPAKTCAELDDDGDGVNNCDDKCLGSTAGEAVGPDGCPVPAPEPAPEPKPFRG